MPHPSILIHPTSPMLDEGSKVFCPPDDREPRTALTDGLSNVQENGWTQDTYYDPRTGECCSLGAIGGDSSAGVAHLAQAIRNSGWTPILGPDDHPFSEWFPLSVIVNWNDEDGRTQSEVEAMFCAAIILSEAVTPDIGATPE